MSRLEIYTDGACEPNPGVGGWSMVVYEDGREVHHEIGGSLNTTNNRMEFEGIYAALAWLTVNNRQGVVFSDSQYCINCLTIWWQKWEKKKWQKNGEPIKNLDLIQSCLSIIDSTPIKWVRGHAGNVGNERADELAGIGRIAVKNA